jgi:hypothetical protein
MIDFWTLGPSAAAYGLRARGFSLREADRLVALKLRHERGEFRELTEYDHLCFLRWRVEHGRYGGDLPYETAHGERSNQ